MDRAVANNIYSRGVEALQRGDAAQAKQCFTELIDIGLGNASTNLMLARASRLGGDLDGELAAIDGALEAEPQNPWALLMRGRWSEEAGDLRAAATFYTAALRVTQSAGTLPPDLNVELQKGRQFLERSAAEFQAALDDALKSEIAHGPAGLRLRHALDMLSGRREIFQQQPSVFYFPYLSQRQFFDTEEFAWVLELESKAQAIKEELVEVLQEGAPFEPYVQLEQNRPARNIVGLLNDPGWSALYLWKNGQLVAENAGRMPKTLAALQNVPLSRIGNRTPSVLFSMLRPDVHIPPHQGMLNCRLICHLPLIVPPGCWLRVGNETREWEEGKLLIFDDSITHEAKNPSKESRVVLLFDIWRPELTENERAGVSAIFDTIDRFTLLPQA